MSEEEKKAYYNKIMVQDTMSVEEAESIIDDMYQDKYKVIEEKNTIYLDRLDDVKFTNLEFASVRMLREIQSLRRKLEEQQKELSTKDKVMRKMAECINDEFGCGEDTAYWIEYFYKKVEDKNT
ncbi:MAG: hypothetical protein Q4D02_01910 [Clostridia bacterium]|nr:hypothetical protein [Clostridia bacterium]